MTKPSRKRNQRAMRNLQSAGWEAAKFTGDTTSKAIVGLSRWVVTDHTGMGRALDNMPKMGFVDSAKYMLKHFLIAVFGTLLGGALIFLFIAYGIPLLIMGHL